VLDRVSLLMPAGSVTALIGPSGCGKSTFLRILNRLRELIPTATLAGEVLIDGSDIYDPHWKLTGARKTIGMVFQRPNPFPAMSIYENVTAGLKLTGIKLSRSAQDSLVEECLTRAGLWCGGPGSPAPTPRRALRRPAATPLHRPVSSRPPPSPPHGRTHVAMLAPGDGVLAAHVDVLADSGAARSGPAGPTTSVANTATPHANTPSRGANTRG
jgi:ABC-type sugar transport system ATPase subunit